LLTPGLPQSMTEGLSGQSALIAEIASDGVYVIVLIIVFDPQVD
jgi:hypothetical protein